MPSRTCSAAEIIEGKLVERDGAGGTRQPPVGQVGQNAQEHAAAGERLDPRGQVFYGSIDSIGAHGVAHIVNEVQNDESANGGIGDNADLQLARAATQFSQHGIDGGSLGQQFCLMGFQEFDGNRDIFDVQKLHLPDHLRGIAEAVKPPPALASLAIKEAPATTEGSSITIGTNTSRPLTTKFWAMPSGRL